MKNPCRFYFQTPFISEMSMKQRMGYLALGILSPFLIAGYALFCIWMIGLIINLFL